VAKLTRPEPRPGKQSRTGQRNVVLSEGSCLYRPKQARNHADGVKKVGQMRLRNFALNVCLSSCVAMAGAAFSATTPQDTQSPKQDMKDAGHATKDAAKDTGHATKKTAKKTGHAVKKDTKKAAHKSAAKTKEGAQKVEDKTAPQ
jgi:hypothetical protein